MNSIDEFSLKKVVLYLDGKSLELKMVRPQNDNEMNELEKLYEQGLIKFQVIDASASFIAHKDVLQKLVNDLPGQNSFSQMVDRTIISPSLVQICASNVWLRKSKLTPEQFEEMVREENLMLENYKKQF